MSLAADLHNARKVRLQRIAAAAAALLEPQNPKSVPEQKPIEDRWIERQITKHKPLWFSVISATKLTPAGQPTIRSIQIATCEIYGVKMNDLLSERRGSDIVMPRQVSMYLAKEMTSLSLPRIARATGNRDHSTAYHAHRKIERLLKSNDSLAAKIALIMERIA